MVQALIQLLQHPVLVVVLRPLLLSKEASNFGELLENGRPQAQLHLVVELRLHLDRWAFVGAQSLLHLGRRHFRLIALPQEHHACRELLEDLRET